MNRLFIILTAMFLTGCASKYRIDGHEWEGKEISFIQPVIAIENHEWYGGDDIPMANRSLLAFEADMTTNGDFCRSVKRNKIKDLGRIVAVPAHEKLKIKSVYHKPSGMFVFIMPIYFPQKTRVLIQTKEGLEFVITESNLATHSSQINTWFNGGTTIFTDKDSDRNSPYYPFYGEQLKTINIDKPTSKLATKALLTELRSDGGVAIVHEDQIEVDLQAFSNYNVKRCLPGFSLYKEYSDLE